MYKLQIRDDEGRSTTVPFLRDEVTIGRKEGNTIRLTERNVSRVHARLTRKDGTVVIEDLSRYGLKINGLRIHEPTDLKVGDSIEIGDYALSLLPEGRASAHDVAEDDEAQTEDGSLEVLEATSLVQKIPSKPSEDLNKSKSGMLVALSTNLAGCEFPLTGEENVIGRTRENNLVIDHRSISRRHAKIVAEKDQFSIFDLGSANGIRINDEEYQQTVLRRGDIVELGHVKLRWIEPGETFLYDDSMALDSDHTPPAKSLLVAGLLATCAAIMGISYFGHFSQPPSSEAISEAQRKVKAPVEAQGTTKEEPEAAEPHDQANPVEPGGEAEGGVDSANTDKVSGLLSQAKSALQARHWQEAIRTYEQVLVLDKNNMDAKSARALARQEQLAAETYERANTLLKDGAYEEAFQVSMKLASISETSAYHNQSEVLRKAVTANYITHLLEEAQRAQRTHDKQRVIELATEILKAEPQNTAALNLLEDASKRKPSRKQKGEPLKKAIAKKSKTSKPLGKKGKTEPKANTESAASAQEKPMTAKELYKAARKAFDSNPQQAIKLYMQAGKKGYAAAWRQLGSLYAQQGNSAKAITFWKKYLTIKPGASDAETIRNAIRRHGGQP